MGALVRDMLKNSPYVFRRSEFLADQVLQLTPTSARINSVVPLWVRTK